MRHEEYTPEDVISAIELSRGLLYQAAKLLGCHRNTILNYANRYEAVRQAIKTSRGMVLDMGESKLFEAAERGEAWAVQFLLKYKAQARGYINQKQLQHTGTDGKPFKVYIGFEPEDI